MKNVLASIVFLGFMSVMINCYGADFNGDGTDDLGIYRPSNGLWSIRGITRAYFGSRGDIPLPGDYNDDASTEASIAIFRPNTGLWAIRGVTRLYFGSSQDIPVPGNYSGLPTAGRMEIAIFRSSAGLWAVKDVTRSYFGTYGDIPLRAVDFDGDGTDDIGIYRPGTSLWAVHGVTRAYFGSGGDLPIPGDYHGDSSINAAMAVYRPDTGLWAVRGITRIYFGASADAPIPANYTGSSPAGNVDIALFRGESGLWAIRGTTRCYWGTDGDLPISNYNPIEKTADIRYTAELSSECKDITYRERGVEYADRDPGSSWSRSIKATDGAGVYIKGFAGCYTEQEYGEVEVNLYINGEFVIRDVGSGIDAEAFIYGTVRIDDDGTAWFEDSSY